MNLNSKSKNMIPIVSVGMLEEEHKKGGFYLLVPLVFAGLTFFLGVFEVMFVSIEEKQIDLSWVFWLFTVGLHVDISTILFGPLNRKIPYYWKTVQVP